MNRRIPAIIAAASTCLALSACGTTTAPQGYFNMTTLGASLTAQDQRTNGDGFNITKEVCIKSGALTATCNYSVDGERAALTVTISPSGLNYSEVNATPQGS